MAKTNWQDPKTSEMRSTHISGLQEAVGKIEESIGISSVAETNITLAEVFISNDDRLRIFQAPAGKRNWLLSPAPVIKKNGSVITQDFEIDYGGGAVIFTTPISESDVLTADATYATKITGKQLSTEDYTTTEKNKLAGIDAGANKIVINNTLTSTSTTQALSAAQGKTLKDAQDAHKAETAYLQEDEPVDVNPTTLWFAIGSEVNFSEGGVVVENAEVSPTPPSEENLWFSIIE